MLFTQLLSGVSSFISGKLLGHLPNCSARFLQLTRRSMLKEMHCCQLVENQLNYVSVSRCRLHNDCSVCKDFGKEEVSHSVPSGSMGSSPPLKFQDHTIIKA